jgi:hypothetical protein
MSWDFAPRVLYPSKDQSRIIALLRQGPSGEITRIRHF